MMNCEIQSKDTSYFKEKVGLGRHEEEEEEEDDAYAMHHPRLSRVVCTRLQDQKKTPKPSDPIGREQNSRPKEFTLGFESKVWRNEMALMWRHFAATSSLKKILLLV